MKALLIKGGRVIDPSRGFDSVGDLLLIDGRVEATKEGSGLSSPGGTRVFDASGLVVAPGFVDMHTHLREPGFEQKETIATGTRAAARGGFTTLCCMANTIPTIDSRATVEFILDVARREGTVRVLPFASVTQGRAGRQLVEMGELAAVGVVGFTDDGSPVVDAGLMRSALTYGRHLGLPIADHCEDPSFAGGVMHEGYVSTRLGLRGLPATAEENMVARDIALARLTGGHAHIQHLSTAGSAELVRRAKEEGLKVTAEVTVHHLTLTHERVAGIPDGVAYDTNTKVNPPLREQRDVDALAEALRDGVIDAVATDHAPHCNQDKLCAYDEAEFGISGLETALAGVLSLVHTGKIPLATLIERMTWGPAQIVDRSTIGLGTLRRGAPGDVSIFDPDLDWSVDTSTFVSKGKNSPLNGHKMRGGIVATVFAGEFAYNSIDKVNP